jgi:PTS system cellobiose-specific IIA component
MGVDRGIAAAHRDGIVTATTLMTNAPATVHAAALARELHALDIGVHLVLTFGRPLSVPADVPSLVETDGSFPRSRSAFVGTGRADAEQALREYRAQFARAEELIGRFPTHIDTHHWVHDEPALEWAIVELARETGAVARQHDAAQRDRFRHAGVRTTDRFCRAFQHEGYISVDQLLSLLQSVAADGDGSTELMCHPGEPDAELLGGSSYARERAIELATLRDPGVREAVVRYGLRLATFAELS